VIASPDQGRQRVTADPVPRQGRMAGGQEVSEGRRAAREPVRDRNRQRAIVAVERLLDRAERSGGPPPHDELLGEAG